MSDRHGDNIHFGRLLVGLMWSIPGLIFSGMFSELGFGVIGAIVLGFLAVPVLFVAIYAAGVIGIWLIDQLNIVESGSP